jgi:hypothetical protein
VTEFLPYPDIAAQVALALMPAGKTLDFDDLKKAIEDATGKPVHPEMLQSALLDMASITYKKGFKNIRL